MSNKEIAMSLKRGDRVKVVKQLTRRGEIGTVVSDTDEDTLIGPLRRVQFRVGQGLIQAKHLKATPMLSQPDIPPTT